MCIRVGFMVARGSVVKSLGLFMGHCKHLYTSTHVDVARDYVAQAPILRTKVTTICLGKAQAKEPYGDDRPDDTSRKKHYRITAENNDISYPEAFQPTP